MTARPLDQGRIEALAARGIAVISVPDIRWGRVDIKTIGLLPNVLAKQSAIDKGARDAWLVDRDGIVTEGASTNAWIVTADGTLVTRPADHAILGGITRAVLFEAVKAQGLRDRGAAVHPGRGLRGARGLCHLGDSDRDAGGAHRRPRHRRRQARTGRDRTAPRSFIVLQRQGNVRSVNTVSRPQSPFRRLDFAAAMGLHRRPLVPSNGKLGPSPRSGGTRANGRMG